MECVEWEGSSAVGCGTVEWNLLSGRAAVQCAALQLKCCAEWEGSSAVVCGTFEWNVLSGRVAVQCAAVQLSGMC